MISHKEPIMPRSEHLQRLLTIARLRVQGLDPDAIAARLHMTRRQVIHDLRSIVHGRSVVPVMTSLLESLRDSLSHKET
jgi:hypothetical protein